MLYIQSLFILILSANLSYGFDPGVELNLLKLKSVAICLDDQTNKPSLNAENNSCHYANKSLYNRTCLITVDVPGEEVYFATMHISTSIHFDKQNDPETYFDCAFTVNFINDNLVNSDKATIRF